MLQTSEESSQTESKPRSGRIFPLYLTPFESFMMLDDTEAFPMAFVVQMSFEGELCQDSFRAAVGKALDRHPLLRAIVQPRKQNRDCWVECKDPWEVDFGDVDDPIEFEDGESIDLRKHVGIRMWVRSNEEGGVITAQFHHSTCDGIGSYQFLGDALWFYAEQVDDTDLPELPELDKQELRNRLRATYNPDHYKVSGDRFKTEWMNSIRWYFTQVNRLLVPKRTKGVPIKRQAFPGIQSIEFDKAWYRKFRKVAQTLALTSNELLLEKMFLTLEQWNKEHGSSGLGQLCVMVPLDLRESKNETLPAANVVTYAFVRAKQSLLKNTEAFRDLIRNEMIRIKNTRHTCTFTNMIVGFVRFPRVMRFVVKFPKSLATATLSNTGDPSRRFHVDFPKDGDRVRCGNLRLTGFSGVPPMRANTRATTSVFTYRRGLKVCMRCDPTRLTEEDTKSILAILEDKLRSVVE